MNATVCIPWRAQPDRLPAYDRVRNFWSHFGFPVIIADSDEGKPFHISEARNNAVFEADTDNIILADADTIPDMGAVYEALENECVTYPFTTYRHIRADYVNAADLMTAPVDREYRRSVGGVLVCPRQQYWNLGGMDERFEARWGYEDNAFHIVASTLGWVKRVSGYIWSFNHAADRDLTDDNPNKHRFALYQAAAGKPAMMRELIKK